MKAAKQVIRKQIKVELRKMSSFERDKQSRDIVQQLLRHPRYIASKRISVYLSMVNEVQTNSILEDALQTGKNVFIPKYVGSNMDMVSIHSMEDFKNLPETSWHIKQPADDDFSREDALESGGLDLIVVPGVAFSKSGGRMGHGKGYYDSYIEKCCRIKVPYLIGLAYTVQMCEHIPLSDHDQLLDEVLTYKSDTG